MQGSGGEEDRRFLAAEVLTDGSPSSWLEDSTGKHVQTLMKSQHDGWMAEQTWGFEEIQGTRYHTRRMIVRKGDESRRARMVYDYVSK
jgi:hypothetical protein